MIAMVVNSGYQCLCMSDIPPLYKSNGHVPSDYSGVSTLDYISEGQVDWKSALDQCLSTEQDTECEFVSAVAARWRANMRFMEADRVLVTMVRVPSDIHKLSVREHDVLKEVAFGKSNSQVAKSLNISLSTVEKHRSHIRQTLHLHSEQELQLSAWMVANRDIFHQLP